MGQSREKVQRVAGEALEAFWKVVAESYPNVTSGDLDPFAVMFQELRSEQLIQQWLDANSTLDNGTERE